MHFSSEIAWFFFVLQKAQSPLSFLAGFGTNSPSFHLGRIRLVGVQLSYMRCSGSFLKERD